MQIATFTSLPPFLYRWKLAKRAWHAACDFPLLMNTTFFIACNKGKLRAFKTSASGSLEQIADLHFDEGRAKISELVTDQAGAFPMSGSTGTSSYESLPLQEELEARSIRKVVSSIVDLLQEHQPGWWALAAPSEINGGIIDSIDPSVAKRISANCKRDLVNVPTKELRTHFEAAAETTA